MARAKAVLKTSGDKHITIQLDDDQQVTIGYGKHGEEQGTERPDFDLGVVLPADEVYDIGVKHAILTRKQGDFWIKTLDGHETHIGTILTVPGYFFRLVSGDTVKLGDVEFTFLGMPDC